ncbi:Oidioi.mRNA.OKI2018_I69.XSR.g17023.t1.cds [Oikopleura dioica]|uniref:Oidioi.mRNA.OKI2018_I69.XSR.g17023.t1.cds n=1 Tax=Oikopleura dioica TaxID=34765 RepID=A0ABN7SP84_OIKDI|nr:Oidioi.mRNA.OKI2018_I69.XSR.g17023.t1.cds [Oikopleura dioica]
MTRITRSATSKRSALASAISRAEAHLLQAKLALHSIDAPNSSSSESEELPRGKGKLIPKFGFTKNRRQVAAAPEATDHLAPSSPVHQPEPEQTPTSPIASAPMDTEVPPNHFRVRGPSRNSDPQLRLPEEAGPSGLQAPQVYPNLPPRPSVGEETTAPDQREPLSPAREFVDFAGSAPIDPATQPNDPSPSAIYNLLKSKLTREEQLQLKGYIQAKEREIDGRYHDLWSDICNQRWRLEFTTPSNRSFTLAGRNWSTESN